MINGKIKITAEDWVYLKDLVIEAERCGDALEEKISSANYEVDLQELSRIANHMKNSVDLIGLKLQWIWSLQTVQNDNLPDKNLYE